MQPNLIAQLLMEFCKERGIEGIQFDRLGDRVVSQGSPVLLGKKICLMALHRSKYSLYFAVLEHDPGITFPADEAATIESDVALVGGLAVVETEKTVIPFPSSLIRA